MKTKLITSALAIIFASASLLAADPAPTVELVNQKGSTIYKIVGKLPGTGKAFLRISSVSGVVFYETLNYTNGLAYPIDFKGMAEGAYTVELLTKGSKFKQVIAIGKTKPVAYVRATEQSGKKQLVTITSETPADFTIRVFDKYDNEVFSKVESVKSEYGVVLNLKNLDAGYSVSVTESTGKLTVIRK